MTGQESNFPLKDFTRRVHLAADSDDTKGLTITWVSESKTLEMAMTFLDEGKPRTVTLTYPLPDDDAFRHHLTGMSIGLNSMIAAISRDLA